MQPGDQRGLGLGFSRYTSGSSLPFSERKPGKEMKNIVKTLSISQTDT